MLPANSSKRKIMLKTATRRQFLKLGVQASLSVMIPLPLSAAINPESSPDRKLAFYNTHTKEALEVSYFKNGKYDQTALDRINFILRDHRTGEVRPIDRNLLNLLTLVASRTNSMDPFHVISGYRSPATNAMLRKISTGVSKKSLHLTGKAIDIRLPQYNTLALRDLCVGLKCGGVGYYSKSNFVHLDMGRVRTWGS